MPELSHRLIARIAREFPDDALRQDVMAKVAAASDSERIQAALVLWAEGDTERLFDILKLVHVDWRHALVRAALEREDWQERLRAELGDSALGP
jgi:hypothetical protein